MRRLIKHSLILLTAGFLLLPTYSFAEEDATISGEGSVIVRTVEGERESSKFEEYREIPDGLSGEAELRYKRKEGYFLEFRAKDIAEDDQYFNLKAGNYGKYRVELGYDKLPHRFAYDAKTLYAGVGSGTLVLSDAMQTNLQSSTSSTDLANRIKDFFTGASERDLELFRKTGRGNVDVMALDPFNLRFEFSREERDGTRPFTGAFGFGNAIELPEPIDYATTQLKVIASYIKKPLYLNATYYLSKFDNKIDTLTWDNPYRVTDSTTTTAYSQTYAAGPSKGLIDLYPDNIYHNLSFSGSLMELPLKSRLSVNTSWGWMKQDDELVPYTTNTAIIPGAANSPPFDASNPANLPIRNVDAKVNTYLYNLLLTSKPLNFLNVKARYRYYERKNKTDEIDFPGYVRMDAVWEPEAEKNEPISYKKNTAGIDLGFNLLKATTLTLGYTYDEMKRSEVREVSKLQDDIYMVSLDTKPLTWLDFRISYEHSKRDGDYNVFAPFEGKTGTDTTSTADDPPQLPWLRKYDEANRKRDRIQLIGTFYPIDPLTITPQAIFGKDDFKDSPFGLNEDKHQIYSLDVDYAFTDRLNLYAFFAHERYKNKQKARQWNPSTTPGSPDPWNVTTTLDSPSNWDAENEDKTNTFGAGLNFVIMPKRLNFDLSYSYSKINGKIDLSSVVGTTTNDLNAFIPVNFTEVDDTILQTLNAKLKYHFKKYFSITLGYMWEKFDIKDFNNTGFSYIPTTVTGAYNGALLMGTLPKDYDAHVIYVKLTFKF